MLEIRSSKSHCLCQTGIFCSLLYTIVKIKGSGNQNLGPLFDFAGSHLGSPSRIGLPQGSLSNRAVLPHRKKLSGGQPKPSTGPHPPNRLSPSHQPHPLLQHHPATLQGKRQTALIFSSLAYTRDLVTTPCRP